MIHEGNLAQIEAESGPGASAGVAPAVGLVPTATKGQRGVVPLIVDTRTGEVLTVNPARRRLARLRRRLYAWGEFGREATGCLGARLVFVTLTYRPEVDPRPGDRKEFMRRTRRRLGGGLLGYSCVAEVTQAGRLHFHYLFLLKKGVWLPSPDKCGLWPWGMTRTERAVRGVGYLVKYASKGELAPGVRAFDVVVKAWCDVSTFARVRMGLSKFPYWLEVQCLPDALLCGILPRRSPRGGYSHLGVVFRSPYLAIFPRQNGSPSALAY